MLREEAVCGDGVGVSEEDDGVEGPGVTAVLLTGRLVLWGLVVSESGCSCSAYGEVCPLWL